LVDNIHKAFKVDINATDILRDIKCYVSITYLKFYTHILIAW